MKEVMTAKELMSILRISATDIKSYLETRYSQIISEYQHGKIDGHERDRQLSEVYRVIKEILKEVDDE
jgi:predicted AlkP superfamily pyrophosphatase or phosphodiesterase